MIELAGVRKTFGAVVAVRDISLTVADHDRIAITGPSGSGKTSLLRLIAGLEIPDRGTITLQGKIANDPGIRIPPSARNIGFVFQTPALWPHMTVRENILFALHDRFPAKANAKVIELLDRMSAGSLKDRYPGQISGGEARRVALARALAADPSILLFDEPLTNLDDDLRRDLLDLIDESVSTSGATMIFVTHNRSEAAKIADTFLEFRNGEIYSS